MRNKTKILKIANKLRKYFGYYPNGCYEISVIVQAVLQKHGLKATIVQGTFQIPCGCVDKWGKVKIYPWINLHFWIECSGFMVDITADQFNEVIEDDSVPIKNGIKMPKVYCVPIKKITKRYHKKKYIIGITAVEALKKLRKEKRKDYCLKKELKKLGL